MMGSSAGIPAQEKKMITLTYTETFDFAGFLRQHRACINSSHVEDDGTIFARIIVPKLRFAEIVIDLGNEVLFGTSVIDFEVE